MTETLAKMHDEMVPITKPLYSLMAADLMSAPLVTIPGEMSIRNAAQRLIQAAVTGAPVVDGDGRCIGVLSTTDFMKWMNRDHRDLAAAPTAPAFCVPWEMVDPAALPDAVAHDLMTNDVVVAPASATLGELTSKMVDGGIHRVIVIDRDGKPLGIVSSTDILAAVKRADPLRETAIDDSQVKTTVAC